MGGWPVRRVALRTAIDDRQPERNPKMEFAEVVAARRSVRHFNTKVPVTEAEIRGLLHAATTAPTAGNIQPWRFFVLRSVAARERLAAAIGQKWASAAPVVIVVCVDPRPCAARYGDRGERLYAVQDTAAAVQTLLLAAVDRGLASARRSAPRGLSRPSRCCQSAIPRSRRRSPRAGPWRRSRRGSRPRRLW